MSSTTEICNLALSHLAVGKEIGNVDTEQSQEASACRRVYKTLLDATLRDFSWRFATSFASLALVQTNPTTEWAYSYQYPTDCVDLRRILSGIRNDTAQSRIPYMLSQTATGIFIFTDAVNAVVEYTMRASNPQFYPPDFVLAFSYRIAMMIAPRVTGGDPFKLGKEAEMKYYHEIEKARAASNDEEQGDQRPESEFISGR